MKKVLFLFLLGTVALLPTGNAKSSIINPCPRIVDCNISGWVLYATSETEDGTITRIEIYRLDNNEKVRTKNCSGYSDNISLTGLAHTTYVAKVICQYTTYTEQFVL